MKALLGDLLTFRRPARPALGQRERIDYESVRRMRMRARLPRYAVLGMVAILAFAGARVAIFGAPPPRIERYIDSETVDVGLEGFAQDYARAYLSWDSSDAAAHQQSLVRFNPRLAQDPGTMAPRSPQVVSATEVVQDEASAVQGRIVTVEVTLAPGSRVEYLAVAVARSQNGSMAVLNFPSFVGAPSVQESPPHPTLQAVNDQELSTVVLRSLTNYVAGDSANLAADLAPGTQVTFPPNQLELTASSGQLSWTGPNGVLATVEVRDQQGASYTLTYEVGVQRSDRWYVNSIEVIPSQ
jgi:Conjugative transposon protein TcpC